MLSSRKSSNPHKFTSSTSENFNSSNRKNNSLTTPALLFYQPKNVNLNTSNCKQSVPCCETHSDEKAIYYSQIQDEEQIIFYCQKCATLVSDQGFTVYPITQKSQQINPKVKQSNPSPSSKTPKIYNPYPQREEQINNFLEILEERKNFLKITNTQVKDTLISSEQFYGEQIEEINQYFEAIIQSLQLQKNKCYNHILLERQNAEKNTRKILSKVQQSEKQIQDMITDIEENIDSVFSITWDNYHMVLGAFDDKLKDIDGVIAEIEKKGIEDVEFRKIEFAGVPDSINSLSQIIIQNSYGDGTVLDIPDQEDDLSDISTNTLKQAKLNHSHYQKQRQNHPKQTPQHQRHNSLIFSFDFQAMRESERINQQVQEEKQNCRSYFLRKVPENQESMSNEEPILRSSKLKNLQKTFDNNFVEPVQGIQEVVEHDVLQMPDENLIQ